MKGRRAESHLLRMLGAVLILLTALWITPPLFAQEEKPKEPPKKSRQSEPVQPAGDVYPLPDALRASKNEKAECGNSTIEYPETCDDGNRVTGDGCSSDCEVEFCGDSVTQTGLGEQCDDGNRQDGDGCSATCQREARVECGNGIVEQGEDCEGEGTPCGTKGVCRNCSCVISTDPLGGGGDEPGKGGGGEPPDGFPNAGDIGFCGNGILDAGEECDFAADPTGCTRQCRRPVCGDNEVHVINQEECDDGNTTAGDGCSATCRFERCGDGIVQEATGEQCDDGNTAAGDGCSGICRIETAGCGENYFCKKQVIGGQCQDAPDCPQGTEMTCVAGSCGEGSCSSELCCTCTPLCGNNIVDEGEECDGGEGCDENCMLLVCAGSVQAGNTGTQSSGGEEILQGTLSVTPSLNRPIVYSLASNNSPEICTPQISGDSISGTCDQPGLCSFSVNGSALGCNIQAAQVQINCELNNAPPPPDPSDCGGSIPITITCEQDPTPSVAGAMCDEYEVAADGQSCTCTSCTSCWLDGDGTPVCP